MVYWSRSGVKLLLDFAVGGGVGRRFTSAV